MTPNDLPEFTTILDAVSTLISRGKYTPSDVSTGIFFRAMARYTLDQVRAAFQAHVEDPQRGRFAPTPADLIFQVEGAAADDGRYGAEEAWAKALPAMDESKTVVWSSEAAEAFGTARTLLSLGDEVAGRLAFKQVYERLVDEARADRRPVRWEASIGTDKAAARAALALAASEGRHACGEGAADFLALPSSIESPLLLAAPENVEGLSKERREMLAQLKAKVIAASEAKRTQNGADFLQKCHTEKLKAEAAERVARYANEHRQTAE